MSDNWQFGPEKAGFSKTASQIFFYLSEVQTLYDSMCTQICEDGHTLPLIPLDAGPRRHPARKCTVLGRQEGLWELSQLCVILMYPQNTQERRRAAPQSVLGA